MPMYIKLVLRNARRSIRDYLIYIVTLTLCVTLFYGFLSITSRYYQPNLGTEYDFTIVSTGLKAAICAVTLFLLFLIHYVNNYMIRRKQKEFAIQTIMGMEQRTTAHLFFAETFLMGLLSIVVGIVLGMIGSQFVTAMLLSSYEQPFCLSWTLFPDTVLLTAGFFMLSFLIVGFWNIRTIRKIKVIDMLSAERKNEGDFRKSKWMPGITFFYGIILAIRFITGISEMYFYFDSRFPKPVHVMYWGNILVPGFALMFLGIWLISILKKIRKFTGLVFGCLFFSLLGAGFAAIVPTMKIKYYLAIDGGTMNQYLMFLLSDLIFFICGFIYLINDIICMIKERSLRHRYHEENLFFYGQITSKLKTTSKTMTLICLTLVLSICLFMAVPILVGWAMGYLDARSVYDVQISTSYHAVFEEEKLPKDNYEAVTQYLEENHIAILEECIFNLYLPKREDFHQRNKYLFPVAAISLTDFNTLLRMRGYEPIFLENGEFTTQWQSVATQEQRQEFLNAHTSISTDGGNLKLSQAEQYEYDLGEMLYNSYTDVIYVLPDKVCEELLAVGRNRYINTVEPVSFENSLELERIFAEIYPEKAKGCEGVEYYIRTRTQQVNSTRGDMFVLQTSMTYGAVVLLVICFTILSLQQLADVVYYRYRFGVLRKMGVEETHINRLILRQLSMWFGLPVSVAALASGVLVFYFTRTVSAQIAAYIGTEALYWQIGMISGVLTCLLICYFVSTWILFKRSVE